MLKIVYPICCGMDVHKSFLVACIASTNECGVTTYKSRRFSTFTKDLRLCADWLSANNCKDVCMESTGKYWIPIYNILEASCKIVLAHPKYVKAIRGKKTTRKMPNGLRTFLSTTLLVVVLFLRQISDNFGIWFATVGSSITLLLEKRTAHRIALLFPTTNWMMFSQMSLARLPPKSLLTCWNI